MPKWNVHIAKLKKNFGLTPPNQWLRRLLFCSSKQKITKQEDLPTLLIFYGGYFF